MESLKTEISETQALSLIRKRQDRDIAEFVQKVKAAGIPVDRGTCDYDRLIKIRELMMRAFMLAINISSDDVACDMASSMAGAVHDWGIDYLIDETGTYTGSL